VIANVGHAYDASWERTAAAHIAAWYPGEGFADAIAAVLAGDREPGGRMPVSIAREEADYPAFALKPDADGKLAYSEGTDVGYRGIIASGKTARHTLGAGIGYTTFSWEDVRLEDDGLSVRVENTGDRTGSDVVQVYCDDRSKALVGFEKITLAAGETTRVFILLTQRRFANWGDDGWSIPAGPRALRIGRDAESSVLKTQVDPRRLPKGL